MGRTFIARLSDGENASAGDDAPALAEGVAEGAAPSAPPEDDPVPVAGDGPAGEEVVPPAALPSDGLGMSCAAAPADDGVVFWSAPAPAGTLGVPDADRLAGNALGGAGLGVEGTLVALVVPPLVASLDVDPSEGVVNWWNL